MRAAGLEATTSPSRETSRKLPHNVCIMNIHNRSFGGAVRRLPNPDPTSYKAARAQRPSRRAASRYLGRGDMTGRYLESLIRARRMGITALELSLAE